MKLSPSSLGVANDCMKCFYLEKKFKMARPRGIFPSLPGGMDRVIKNYFDAIRTEGEPIFFKDYPELGGHRLFTNQAQLDKWRNWRSGLSAQVSSAGDSLGGAFDELMLNEENLYVPFDYKTKGSETSQEDSVKYYQRQLDLYALMLDKNGYKAAPYGFLFYFSPDAVLGVSEGFSTVRFKIQLIKIDVSLDRAMQVCQEALDVLAGAMPKAPVSCEYCRLYEDRHTHFCNE